MSIVFRDLNIYGFGRRLDYQKSVSTFLGAHAKAAFDQLRRTPRLRVDILQDFEGIVTNGEMLLVLGKPGSGCTTFLKTLAGHMSGLHCDDGSTLNYQGIPTV
jgi:ATP-binding cassette subfamily G (WHITE) protein 2 (PDR)